MRAKTGSIGGVNTLSGYIEQAGGEIITFSVQANHHTQTTRTILAAIDSVVVESGEEAVAPLLSPPIPLPSSSSATLTPGKAIRPSGPTTATARSPRRAGRPNEE